MMPIGKSENPANVCLWVQIRAKWSRSAGGIGWLTAGDIPDPLYVASALVRVARVCVGYLKDIHPSY